MKKLISILLLFTISISLAQNEINQQKSALGINLGLSLLNATIEKNYLLNFNINKTSNRHIGSQFHLGLNYFYPITNFIKIGLSTNLNNSIFKITSQVNGIMLNQKNDSINSTYNHELNYTFSKVSIIPFIYFQPFKNLNFILTFENNFLFDNQLIFNKNYSGANNYVFPENHYQNYTIYSGKIKDTKNYTNSIAFSIGYEIFLDKQKFLSLTPNAYISLPLNSELINYNWSTSRYGLNINLNYYITPSKSYEVNYKEIFLNDTIIIKKLNTFQQIKQGKTFYSTTIDTTNNFINYTRIASKTDTLFQPLENFREISINSDTLLINKQVIKTYHPLLTEYYFELNTAKLINPSNIELLNNDINNILQISKYSLDSIAFRLNQNPQSKILIRAYKDISENSDCSITLERSNTLKQIFLNNFKLEESQIQIDTNLNDCTYNHNNDIKTQNAKAEIISIYSNIIAPLYNEQIIYDFNDSFTIKINDDSIKVYTIIEKSQIKFLTNSPELTIKPVPKNLFETSNQITLEFNYNKKIIPHTINLQIQEKNILNINFLTFEKNTTKFDPLKIKFLEIILSQIKPNSKISLKAYSFISPSNQVIQKIIENLKIKLQELLYIPEVKIIKQIKLNNTDNPYLLYFRNAIFLEIEVN